MRNRQPIKFVDEMEKIWRRVFIVFAILIVLLMSLLSWAVQIYFQDQLFTADAGISFTMAWEIFKTLFPLLAWLISSLFRL